MICDSSTANDFAVSLNRYTLALKTLHIGGSPAALLANMKARDQAERDLRDSFRAITGWTLVYKRGRYGVRR